MANETTQRPCTNSIEDFLKQYEEEWQSKNHGFARFCIIYEPALGEYEIYTFTCPTSIRHIKWDNSVGIRIEYNNVCKIYDLSHVQHYKQFRAELEIAIEDIVEYYTKMNPSPTIMTICGCTSKMEIK